MRGITDSLPDWFSDADACDVRQRMLYLIVGQYCQAQQQSEDVVGFKSIEEELTLSI